MTRRLVITADDLGREPYTTRVVTALLAQGGVTATTLIPVAGDAGAAAAAMRRLGCRPHLHLTLTSERGLEPWRPLTGAASLVNGAGVLPADAAALTARAEPSDVVAELDAQLAWMRAHGLDPVAADSHAGVLYGLHGRSFLQETLRWCARNSLGFRLPRDPVPFVGGPLPGQLAAAHAEAVALADTLGVALPETIVTNRLPASELGAYDVLLAQYLARLRALPDGVSEMFLHPSAEGAVEGPDGAVRGWEARLLRDPRWASAIADEGIELVEEWV